MNKRKFHLNWRGYYLYTSTNVDSYIPKRAGVYKISVKLKSGKLKPFYVGQALDLNDRLNLTDFETEDLKIIKESGIQQLNRQIKFIRQNLNEIIYKIIMDEKVSISFDFLKSK